MTGFGGGRAQIPELGLVIEVEIQSVNRKTLDAHINLPREWSGLEPDCQAWLKEAFTRGRVNVQLKANLGDSEGAGLVVADAALDESLDRLRRYAESRGIPFAPDASVLLELAKVLKDTGDLPDWTNHKTIVKEAFDKALAEITRMREAEGAALVQDLSQRIDLLDTLVKEIQSASPDASRHYRDVLLDRLRQIGLDLDLDDDRVLKEVALVADRCDISEELTRLKSHFAQFREFIASDEPTGRKMDFLCQEIHREFNTCGSKTNQIEVTRAVIEGKNELERIREQVQNVE